jgi:hypothetical protein
MYRSTVFVEGNAVMTTVADASNEGKSRSYLNIYQSESPASLSVVAPCCRLALASDKLKPPANFEVLRRAQDGESHE